MIASLTFKLNSLYRDNYEHFKHCLTHKIFKVKKFNTTDNSIEKVNKLTYLQMSDNIAQIPLQITKI